MISTLINCDSYLIINLKQNGGELSAFAPVLSHSHNSEYTLKPQREIA